jgi:hypothetical protein
MTTPDSPDGGRQPVPLTEEVARSTIRSLAGRVEAVAFVIQAFSIFSTINADKLDHGEQLFLILFAGAHLVVAAITARTGGPFYTGGAWPFAWIGVVLAMPVVMALFVPPGDYGISPTCPQLCGYPVSPVAIAAFYPWIGNRYNYVGIGPMATLATVISLEPLLLMFIVNGRLTSNNMQGTLAQAIMVGGMWAAGEAIGRICRRAAAAQSAILRREYDRQFSYLHSDIETGMKVAEIHLTDGRPEQMLSALQELRTAVLDERLRLSLAREHVSVADVMRLHISRVSPALTIDQVSSVDVLTIPHSAADLVSRTLGDLLKNVLEHGGDHVRIGFDIIDGSAQLTVSDNGPGFDRKILRDPTESLGKLRTEAESAGGTLNITRDCNDWLTLVLTCPITQQANGR